MKTRICGVSAVMALMLTAGASSARATITYNLTTDNCTGSCLTGVVGTATVAVTTLGGGNGVSVLITLPAPLSFVNTGLQETIDFNLGTANTLTADNFSNAHFSLSSTVGGNHFDGFGNFVYAIKMDTAQGAGGAQPSPLSFQLHQTGLTETSFLANSQNWFWGVDVYNSTRNTTGPIGAGSGGVLSGGGNPVPEPGSIVLLSTVFLGLTAVMRKRAQRSV
jgi:hypothetical protein